MGVKAVTVVGARPQFVKAAPLVRALRRIGVVEVLVHTGQHHDADLSQVFFDDLELDPPRHNLGIHGGSHAEMTARMLQALEPVFISEAPDIVVLFGDTNSTIAGALAAAKLQLPIAHIEAGLRSFNRAMPEEINRIVTDHLSTLLLAPTHVAVENLAREGIDRGVYHVGDVMYDVAIEAATRAREESRVLERLQISEREYAVATIHRAENTDDPRRLRQVLEYLQRESSRVTIVMPLHPRTRRAIESAGLRCDGLVVTPPLSYLDMARLLSSAQLVFTDSGGVQKEAYFHRVPCVTIREETEWVETLDAGWNRLWHSPEYAPRRAITDYGEGTAATRCAELIASLESGQRY